MKIAIFGGSFDPIHRGHLDIITNLFTNYDMDKVIVIPTNVSYYKKNNIMFTFNQRLEICKASILNDEILKIKNIEVSDIENETKENEGFAHTLLRLRKLYPNDTFYTVIGSDSYNYINTWREYEKILDESKLIVVTRPGNKIDESMGIDYLPLNLNNNISSTQIRKEIMKFILNRKD